MFAALAGRGGGCLLAISFSKISPSFKLFLSLGLLWTRKCSVEMIFFFFSSFQVIFVGEGRMYLGSRRRALKEVYFFRLAPGSTPVVTEGLFYGAW